MTYILYGLFILACIVLVVVVLLQPGKADAGALFSSSVSSTAFGPRGTQTLLAKITIGAAAVFMLCALGLGIPAITGTRSVLQGEGEGAPQTVPTPGAAPANTNTSSQPATQPESSAPANANAAAPAATNTNAAAPAATNANATTTAPAASNTANAKPNPKAPAKK